MTDPTSRIHPVHPATVGEVKSFIDLLRLACDDPRINTTLGRLLALEPARRQSLVHAWVTELLVQQAPRDFTRAIACLLDDAVADKARAVIFRCSYPSARPAGPAPGA